jgi:cis-1,2-dihydro-1,2-dihydroxynaphthalene/dibenzothiophene dihydrodiol dehydrogenase
VAVTLGDVTSAADNAAAVERTTRAFGDVDTLVANAGIFDFMRRFTELDAVALDEAFSEIFAVNVKGYLLAALAAVTPLRRTRGSIIFTSSTSGSRASVGGVLYVASKHAVVGITRQLAHELAPEIRVNAVAPGATWTGLSGAQSLGLDGRRLDEAPHSLRDSLAATVPLGFVAEPEQHAGLYVCLAAREEAPYVTGTVIASDGGVSAAPPVLPVRDVVAGSR